MDSAQGHTPVRTGTAPARAGTRRRRRRFVVAAATTATFAVLASLASNPAQASPSPSKTTSALTIPRTRAASAAALAVPANVRLAQTRTSKLGTHAWYRQVKDGHVVVGGWWARHVDLNGAVTIWDGRRDVSKYVGKAPEVSALSAEAKAAEAADASESQTADAGLMILPEVRSTDEPRLVWSVHIATGRSATLSYVDAATGTILQRVTVSKQAEARSKTPVTGRGQVFEPNPVVKLQNQGLRDRGDSATAVPAAGYTVVDLPRLNESHSLAGRWVRIMNRNRATSATNRYFFNRANDKFEQVSAYYAVDAQQNYLRRLGFTDVNAEAEKVYVDAFPDDNSYYDPAADAISLGAGGVDDAEDLEVTWHEYGHAIQADQVPDWGWRGHTGAIGEGFGDYMAVAMSQAHGSNTAVTPAACVMDWDATSYTSFVPHCLRRTDGDKLYPDDWTGEVHADGEIWSRALWDMNRNLGRDVATTIIIESHFWMNPKIFMPAAARVTVSTARQLYGDGVAATTRQAFADRHILQPI